jgi:PknH-like extracellular domain
MRHCGLGDFEAKCRWLMRAAAACAVVAVTLGTISPPAGATTVPPGRIISLIPSDDEVSQFIGFSVRHVDDPLPVRPRGADHLDQRDECRTLAFTNTEDVWGSDYAAYRSQLWKVPSDPDRVIVGQSVGTFLGTSAARDRFNAVYNPNLFNICTHAEFRGPGVNPGIMLELYDFKIDDPIVMWTLAAKYYGQYNGWNCVYVGWHLGNVISVSSVGQEGNPSQAVKRLTDHILDRVG